MPFHANRSNGSLLFPDLSEPITLITTGYSPPQLRLSRESSPRRIMNFV
jgi:hypothetical protein